MIYVFLADGFEEIEAITTIDILRRAEYKVQTVGINKKEITGSHKITVIADLQDSDVTTDELDMIVLPGGMPGTLNLEKSPIVHTCIEYCIKENKTIAAICAAPSILGHMGLLNGKEAVCFPGFENELDGCSLSKNSVCVSDKVITAKGAGVAVDFALKIVEEFSGTALSKKLRAAIQC